MRISVPRHYVVNGTPVIMGHMVLQREVNKERDATFRETIKNGVPKPKMHYQNVKFYNILKLYLILLIG